MSKTKDLAVVEEYAIQSVDSKEIAAMIAEAAGPGGLTPQDLDKVKIPSGGATQWAVPNLEGETYAPAIEGVLIHHQDARAYWAASFEETGGAQQPDCASQDGITGDGTPGGVCARCPLAQFGSGKGNAQACKAMKILYVLPPDGLLPIAVTCSPASIKPVKQYLLRLASKGMKPQHVVTKFSLEKAKSKDGISYAKIVLAVSSVLPDDLRMKTTAYAETLKPKMDKVNFDQADVES